MADSGDDNDHGMEDMSGNEGDDEGDDDAFDNVNIERSMARKECINNSHFGYKNDGERDNRLSVNADAGTDEGGTVDISLLTDPSSRETFGLSYGTAFSTEPRGAKKALKSNITVRFILCLLYIAICINSSHL
jgi:hypothetical protein